MRLSHRRGLLGPVFLFLYFLLLPVALVPQEKGEGGGQGVGKGDGNLYQMATRAFNDGSLAFAQSRFRKIIEDYPQSSFRPGALYYTGLCLLYTGDLEKARQSFDDLARLYPQDPLVIRSRAHVVRILLARDKPGQAVEEARSSLKRFVMGPQEGEMHLLLAQAYFRQGLDETGFKELALVGDPLRDHARFETAMLHQKRGRLESALEIFSGLSSSLSPSQKIDGNPEPDLREKSIYWQMKTLLQMQRIDEAAQVCAAFVMEYGQTPSPLAQEARFLHAYLPYEKSDFKNALIQLGNFLNSEPESVFVPDANYFSARCREEIGQDVMALASYQEMVALGPKGRYYSDALGRALRLYARRGDESGVSQTLSNLEAVGMSQGREGPLRELAAYFVETKPDRAEVWYRKLLALGFRNPDNLKGLSYALLKQGRMEEAHRTLTEAAESVKTTGEKADLMMLLAENYFEAKRFAEAAEGFKKVIEQFPDSPRVEEAADGRAWSLFEQKNYDGSWTVWQSLRSAKKQSLRAGAWYAMAEASRLGGHGERAAVEYEAFAANFPEDTRRALARQKAGRLYYDQKAYDKALAIFLKLKEEGGALGDRVGAVYWMAWCRLQQKQEGEAVSLWNSLTGIDSGYTDPRTIDGQLVCAKILSGQMRPAEARKIWEKLVSVLPSMNPVPAGPLSEAWWQLTLLANREDREADADLCFARLVECQGVSASVVFSAAAALADRAMERRRDERALAYYTKALENAPANKERRLATFWKSVALKQTGKLAEAKEGFEGLVALGPEDGRHEFYWQAMMEWAEVQSSLGQSAAAERAWKELAAKAPDQGLRQQAQKALSQGQGRGERGQVMNEEDPQKLSDWAKRALDSEAKALANLKSGRLLLAKGQFQGATQAFKQGANLSTTETGALAQTELVRLLYQQGQYDLAWQEGLSYFYQFDRFRNDEAELLFLTADSARRTGQTGDATRLGGKLLRLYGQSSWGQKWAAGK